jgi:cytosine/adenosine deaminase-related metal-dependent hydrolase
MAAPAALCQAGAMTTGAKDMAATRILIRGARVFDRDGDVHRPPVRDVVVAGDRIEAVVEAGAADAGPAMEVIDASDRLLVPGLVNAHYHSYDVLAKGRFEDMPFDVWALYAQPAAWGPRSRAELRARTLLGAMECLRHGITTVQDMHALVPQDEETLDTIRAAYAEVGIRVVFSIAARDLPQLDIAPFLPDGMPAAAKALVGGAPGDAAAELAFIAAQLDRIGEPPRWHWAVSPSGPQRCSLPLLEGLGDLAARRRLPVLTHVYETRAQLARARTDYARFGGSLVGLMAATGLLGARTTLVHGVYLAADEIGRLAGAGAGVVHNPLSNLKLKNGVAPLLALKRGGVNIALGCDNCSCSDCQNLFQAMKMFVLLAGAMDGEPTGVTAADAIDAATIGGARALGLDGEIGAVRAGMKADLALLDLTGLAWLPFNSAARQLVYSESGAGVDTVIVDGRVVLRGGRIETVDEAAFRAELREVMAVADGDYEALVARRRPAVAPLLDANAALHRRSFGVERLIGKDDPPATSDRGA